LPSLRASATIGGMIPRQKIAVLVGGALMLAVAIWPPWYYEADGPEGETVREYRLGFVLAPPAPEATGDAFRYRVAWEIQAVLWGVIGGLTLGAVLALRERRGRLAGAKRKRSARAGDVRRGRR